MKAPINSDNIYKVGMIIYARQSPGVKLIIMAYKERTYYCQVAGVEGGTTTVYFEWELMAPIGHKQKLRVGLFSRTRR